VFSSPLLQRDGARGAARITPFFSGGALAGFADEHAAIGPSAIDAKAPERNE
jgi:hypothetical protein